MSSIVSVDDGWLGSGAAFPISADFVSTVDALLRAPMPPSVSFLPRTTCPRAAALGRCRNTRTAGGEDNDDNNDDLDDESEDAGGARKVAAVTFINHRPRHLPPLSLSLSPPRDLVLICS